MSTEATSPIRQELEKKLLLALVNAPVENSFAFVDEDVKLHEELIGVIKSLESRKMVVAKPAGSAPIIQLTDEGKKIVEVGSPEFIVYNAVDPSNPDANSRDDVRARAAAQLAPFNIDGKDIFQLAFGHCVRSQWIKLDAGKIIRLNNSLTNDATREWLQGVEQLDAAGRRALAQNKQQVDGMKKRGLIVAKEVKYVSVEQGEDFALERKERLEDLTVETLRSGAWKETPFKEFNVLSLGAPLRTGALHPLQKVRYEFRMFLIQMGFEEMPTNNYVESSFWNFDSLFQPQQHPARDAHDTFFLSEPAEADIKTLADPAYIERVKEVHESGGYGSVGYRYSWKIEEAAKNILRTHTTAVSSRMLAKLAEEYKKTGVFRPVKYFSIDRVFRNETLDATHLAEFHQVEGLVADRNLTLGDLIGTIKTFFEKIGITELKFKPAYNPYTEPSMEIFSYSKDLGKWIEVGNSGIFRPEMLEPMGLPSDVRVIAWGLSLERPTMIKYGLKNIRGLVGPKMQLGIIRSNGIARYP